MDIHQSSLHGVTLHSDQGPLIWIGCLNGALNRLPVVSDAIPSHRGGYACSPEMHWPALAAAAA